MGDKNTKQGNITKCNALIMWHSHMCLQPTLGGWMGWNLKQPVRLFVMSLIACIHLCQVWVMKWGSETTKQGTLALIMPCYKHWHANLDYACNQSSWTFLIYSPPLLLQSMQNYKTSSITFSYRSWTSWWHVGLVVQVLCNVSLPLVNGPWLPHHPRYVLWPHLKVNLYYSHLCCHWTCL